MTLLYRVLIWVLTPLVFTYLWWRGRKAPAYRERWAERLALQQFPAQARDGIVIHCVSVGETVAARALIEAILARYPQLPVTLTSMTPTAADLAQKLFADRVYHYYLPIDTRAAMRRFIDGLSPRLLMILETELWPNLIQQCHQQQIPVLVMNARLSARSAASYQRYNFIIGPIWQTLSGVAGQTQATLERMQQLGLPMSKARLTGNLKLDASVPDAVTAAALAWQQNLARPIWVAASTHANEDEIILAAHQQLLQDIPDLLLILVPRHPERFGQVAELLAAAQMNYQRRSSEETISEATQVLLGDTMGELLFWYSAADAAFVGGSLIPRGGHNPLEPMAAKTPLISGKYVFNFEEIYQRLEQANAVSWAVNSEQIATAVLRVVQDHEFATEMTQRASAAFVNDRGATERMLDLVQQTLPLTSLASAVTVRQPRTLKMIATHTPARGQQIWFDTDFFDQMTPAHFSAAHWQALDAVKGAATGRSTAYFIEHEQHQLLLRHYYRGGLVGKVNKDRFKRESIANSRAMAEFALLLKLRELQLPVPRPVAALYQRAAGWGYRADILVEVIAGAKDVFKLLSQQQLSEQQWYELGSVIRQLHDTGVYHSDLNCHNLMLDADDKAWIVDFDKCGFRQPGEWSEQNLQRLLRSLKKEQKKATDGAVAFHWQEDRDWPLLRAGYDQSA